MPKSKQRKKNKQQQQKNNKKKRNEHKYRQRRKGEGGEELGKGEAKAITSRRREIKSTHKNVLGNPLLLSRSVGARHVET